MDSNKNSFVELINELIAKIKALFSDDKPNEQNNPNDAEELIAGASAPIITASVMAPGDDGSSSGSPQSVNTPGPLDSGNDVAASHHEEGLLSEHSNSPSKQNVFLPPLKSTTPLAPEIIPDTVTNLDLSDPSQATRYTTIQVKNGSATIQSSILGVGNVRTGLDDLAIGSPTESTVYFLYGNTAGIGANRTIQSSNLSSYNEKQSLPVSQALGTELFSMPSYRTLGTTVNIIPDLGEHARFIATRPNIAPGASLRITGTDSPNALSLSGFSTSLPIGDNIRGGFEATARMKYIGSTKFSQDSGYIGDINSDGFSDSFITDRDPSSNTAHIIYGGPDFNGANIDNLNDNSDKTIFINLGTGTDHKTLSYLGKINNDGQDYIAITSPSDNKIRVITGIDNAGIAGLKGLTIDASNIDNLIPSMGILKTFLITSDGVNQLTGAYAIGDTNGDGIVDIAVTTNTGTIFVIYGLNQSMNNINVDHLSEAQGYKIIGAQTDSVIITARDINGDSMNDFIISSPSQKNHLLIYGFNDDPAILRGTAGDNSLSGDSNHTILHGGLGNDTLIQNTSASTLLGGVGDDTIQINNLSKLITVDGGLGDNKLTLSSGIDLDLTTLKNDTFDNFNKIEINGGTLKLGLRDLLDLNDNSSSLVDSETGVTEGRSLRIEGTGQLTIMLDHGTTKSGLLEPPDTPTFTGGTHNAYQFILASGDTANITLFVDRGITVSFSGEFIT